VRYLAALGHRRIARVGGIAGLAHTVIRTDAFTAACAALGLAGAVTVPTDYTGEAGAAATRELLAGSPRPTALIFDNDIMAIAGLTVAQDLGLRVPADLSVVAWDDSPVCELVHPPLTALTRDIRGYGAHAARVLLAALAGEPVASQQAAPAQLTPRGSTGPAALART
jgi:DNA-binding LacI/PurR family transcriptional regulator